MTGLVIGIAGTAKNTGKTTALSALLSEVRKEPGRQTALTSIGYDGEDFDNITGLPKPRISVARGEILAAAERCLCSGDASLEVIQKTGLRNPLGRIIISRVTRPGKAVLAGPNNRRDLDEIIGRFSELGAGLTIIDGALNRIAPLASAKSLLLCTGAARNTDPDLLAAETRLTLEILQTPVLVSTGPVANLTSVLNQAGFERFTESARRAETICLEGIFSEALYPELLKRAEILSGKRLIFADSIKLLLSGQAGATRSLIDGLKSHGVRVGVSAGLNPAAVTVNPYYPKYRYDRKDYEAAYVDRDKLLARLSAELTVPVFDVVRQGGRGIYEALLSAR